MCFSRSYYYFTLCKMFTSALAGGEGFHGSLSDSKSLYVSWTLLCILANLHSTFISMVTILLISNSYSLSSKSGIVNIYIYLYILFYFFHSGPPERQNPRDKLSFYFFFFS